MCKIAILSDAHLLIQAERYKDENTRSPRGELSLQNFNRVISQVIAEEPHAIILAGDMFDEREKGGELIADSEAAKYWPEIRSEIKRLMSSTKYGIYALRGNHDSASVLKELQDYLGDGFQFVRDEAREICGRQVYFLETRYRQGNYRIPDEELPGEGEILIMHETIPQGIPGLEQEIFQKLGQRFAMVLNGHMHHYAHGPLDIDNLYNLPALIPSRQLKNNFTVKYQWPGDLQPEVRNSPFGYVMLNDELSFRRYTPIQSIVRMEIKGDTPADVISGVDEIYSRLMEREDRNNIWVWISAEGVSFKDTVAREANKYLEINTMDIDVRAKKDTRKPAELKGMDTIISLSDLQAKVLSSMPWPDREVAQKVFDEIFTASNLSKRPDSNLSRYLFQRLLELSATDYGVSQENLPGFLQKVEPLWKKR